MSDTTKAAKTPVFVPDDLEATIGERVAHMDCNADLNRAETCSLIWVGMGETDSPEWLKYSPINVDYVKTHKDRKAHEGDAEHPEGFDLSDTATDDRLTKNANKQWSRRLADTRDFIGRPDFCVRNKTMPTKGASSVESAKAMEAKAKREAAKSPAVLKQEQKITKAVDQQKARDTDLRAARDQAGTVIAGLAKAGIDASKQVKVLTQALAIPTSKPLNDSKERDRAALKEATTLAKDVSRELTKIGNAAAASARKLGLTISHD